jgi:hypothetical protein
VYNLNYTPTALEVQSWRKITSGGHSNKEGWIPVPQDKLFVVWLYKPTSVKWSRTHSSMSHVLYTCIHGRIFSVVYATPRKNIFFAHEMTFPVLSLHAKGQQQLKSVSVEGVPQSFLDRKQYSISWSVLPTAAMHVSSKLVTLCTFNGFPPHVNTSRDPSSSRKNLATLSRVWRLLRKVIHAKETILKVFPSNLYRGNRCPDCDVSTLDSSLPQSASISSCFMLVQI